MDKIIDTPEVEESTVYDNFIGKKEDIGSLEDLFGEQDTTDKNDKEWIKHWKGMPSFENDDNPAYKTINVRFRTKEDYDEFAKIIGQKLTDKTKSIWHPALDKKGNALLRWIEESEEVEFSANE